MQESDGDEGIVDEEVPSSSQKTTTESKKRKKKRKRVRMTAPCDYVEHEETAEERTFESFNLDEQLLKAIGELGWKEPTLVQSEMIPLIFENKNVLARARTGSGKTAAFMLPIVQKVLQLRKTLPDDDAAGPYALFIVPSKELGKQTFSLLQHLTEKFPFILSMNLVEMTDELNDDIIGEHPDMLVATPSRLLQALRRHKDPCESVRHVVLDEADLLLSFGYADEMKQIKNFLPKHHQTIMASATMSEHVGPLKELYVSGPVAVLKLKEGQLPNGDQLEQYQISCQNDEERFAIFLALLKLKLIKGKAIIFVKNTNRCYQLGLFLQAFEIRSCILNAEMPMNSRCHVVDEYNADRYSYIIASDISDLSGTEVTQFLSGSHVVLIKETSGEKAPSKKKRKHNDRESGVARGIDFHHVANVINFDFPPDVDTYIHRVGRTARGWNKGTALSFVSPEEKSCLNEVQDELSAQFGSTALLPYEIRIKELETFLLRAREVLHACTRTAIREARLAEIRAEIMRSKRLESYFAKNPREKAVLQHDKKLFTVQLHSPAIADMPEYMIPPSLRRRLSKEANETKKKRKKRGRNREKPLTHNQLKYKKKMEDPLQSFSV